MTCAWHTWAWATRKHEHLNLCWGCLLLVQLRTAATRTLPARRLDPLPAALLSFKQRAHMQPAQTRSQDRSSKQSTCPEGQLMCCAVSCRVPTCRPSMRSCHCKKSQCLKLYCDCFANNQYCSGCACLACKNVESNAQVRAGRAGLHLSLDHVLARINSSQLEAAPIQMMAAARDRAASAHHPSCSLFTLLTPCAPVHA